MKRHLIIVFIHAKRRNLLLVLCLFARFHMRKNYDIGALGELHAHTMLMAWHIIHNVFPATDVLLVACLFARFHMRENFNLRHFGQFVLTRCSWHNYSLRTSFPSIPVKNSSCSALYYRVVRKHF